MGTPPVVGMNVSDAENQGDNGAHKCMSSGGTNPCQFQGIDPRGGAEFDENGPNLIEDIDFAIGTTVRSKCTALLNRKHGRFGRVQALASAHVLRLTTYYYVPEYFG